jgi:hypothetical protein
MTRDHYAKQEPKTCQPECACACHRTDSPACVACGGVDEMLRAAAEQDAHDRVAPDGRYEPLQVVDRCVEAFLAGARFAAPTTGAPR